MLFSCRPRATCSHSHWQLLLALSWHNPDHATTPEASTHARVQDLWQFPDRQNWYKAKFVADDAPDFQPATLESTRQASAQFREVTVDIEISRERVPLRNAYRHIGQLARVRLSSGLDYDVPGQHLCSAAGWQAVLCTPRTFTGRHACKLLCAVLLGLHEHTKLQHSLPAGQKASLPPSAPHFRRHQHQEPCRCLSSRSPV